MDSVERKEPREIEAGMAYRVLLVIVVKLVPLVYQVRPVSHFVLLMNQYVCDSYYLEVKKSCTIFFDCINLFCLNILGVCLESSRAHLGGLLRPYRRISEK